MNKQIVDIAEFPKKDTKIAEQWVKERYPNNPVEWETPKNDRGEEQKHIIRAIVFSQ